MKVDLSDKKVVAGLQLPKKVVAFHWDTKQKHLGIAVSPKGKRTWILERRVAGRNVRRTLGDYDRLDYRAAVREFKIVDGELEQGIDPVAEQKAAKAAAEAAKASECPTLAAALDEYVEGRRRAKDAKPLKERTQSEYLAMVEAPRMFKSGKGMTKGGELWTLAGKRLDEISGPDIRQVHVDALKRGERRAVYAMQVLRAVLNWHGITVADNPLSKAVAGKDRVILAPTVGKPNPIPEQRIAAWWKASYTVRSQHAADLLRLMLLTGLRGAEVKAMKVGDVDLVAGVAKFTDTKNRKDHVVYLSKQAAEIIERAIAGKKSSELVFTVEDAGKTMASINAAAGMVAEAHTPHHLRHTFASIAEAVVSAYALKAMLNHADSSATGFYVGKSEQQLRAGWQAVADFCCSDC